MQSDHVIYRNPTTPVVGTPSGSTFAFPGDALSASTFKMHFDKLAEGRRVKYARWILVWTPRTVAGGGATAVRLVMFDDGPSNIVVAGRIGSPVGVSSQSPRTDQVDVTDVLNDAIAAGNYKQFGHQTAGTGSSGCYIYSSSVEIVWE